MELSLLISKQCSVWIQYCMLYAVYYTLYICIYLQWPRYQVYFFYLWKINIRSEFKCRSTEVELRRRKMSWCWRFFSPLWMIESCCVYFCLQQVKEVAWPGGWTDCPLRSLSELLRAHRSWAAAWLSASVCLASDRGQVFVHAKCSPAVLPCHLAGKQATKMDQ